MARSHLSFGSWIAVCSLTALCAGFILGIELSRMNAVPDENCSVPTSAAIPVPVGSGVASTKSNSSSGQ